jgi:hypothetical protein
MVNSDPNPDRSSGTTDSVQHSNHSFARGTDGGTSGGNADTELSPSELAHLFAESSDDVSEIAAVISRRGDALAAESHSLAEGFDDGPAAVEREQLDALATEVIEGLADLERWSSDLHALLVAVEEARARLDEQAEDGEQTQEDEQAE